MSGKYIAFEGIEGAGKSTVVGALADVLESAGREVVTTREPGGTEVGESIRSILLDPALTVAPWAEAMLFAASRAQLAREVIRPALERGAWVLSDRTVYSSLAYQGGGRGLGVDLVRTVTEAGLDGVWPDEVVLLDLEASTGLDRQRDPDRIGAETHEFHTTVRTVFADLAASEPDRFVIVDATRPVMELVQTLADRWLDHA